MSSTDYDTLINHIYTSQFSSSRWQETIRKIAAYAGFDGGKLINLVDGNVHLTGSHPFYGGIAAIFREEGENADIRLSRYFERGREGFVPDYDLCSIEEIRQTRIYRQVLGPNRLQASVGCAFRFGSRATTVIILDSKDGRRPLEESCLGTLSLIGGHLRASIKGVHDQQDSVVDAVLSYMDAHQEAVATIDPAGTIRSRNFAFQRAVPKLVSHVSELTDTADATTANSVSEALSLIGKADDTSMRVIRGPLAELDRRDYTRVRIIPSRRSPGDIFHVPFAYVHLVREPLERDELARINAALFSLTKAEADIAVALAAGETPAEIAARTGVSVATVRTHIRSLFRKTGSHQRSELVARLYK